MDLLSCSNTEELQDEFMSADVVSSSDDEENREKGHTKLLEAINSLDSKKRKLSNRTEASSTISEFNLTEGGREKVKLHELVASLKDTSYHVTVKKQLNSVVRHKNLLPVPLNPDEEEKIRRGIEYKKVCKEVSKWDSIVAANRAAEQLVFPLKQPNISIRPASGIIKKFKPQTSLEIEVNNILNSSDNVLTKNSVLTPAEEKALKSLSLEEAKLRHENLQKSRALLSYQEAKFRRQKKIKSKKYHRILKHERLRVQAKEFEQLKKTNPRLAMDEIEKIDKLRILERMTLKHKNTGKWAKQRMLRAKHDPNVREALARQLELSNQLTQKIHVSDSDNDEKESNMDSDDDVCKNTEEQYLSTTDNSMWQTHTSHSSEYEVLSAPGEEMLCSNTLSEMWQTSESKHMSHSTVEKKARTESKTAPPEDQERMKVSFADEQFTEQRPLIACKPGLQFSDIHKLRKSEDEEELLVESLERKQTMGDFDITDKEECKEETSMSNPLKRNKYKKCKGKLERASPKKVPESFLNTETTILGSITPENSNLGSRKCTKNKKCKGKLERASPKKGPESLVNTETTILESVTPDITTIGEDSLDDDSDDGKKISIEEACRDEELFGQFREEKRAVIEKDKPENIDTFLPGWGTWAGSGIRISQKKRKRFIIQVPPPDPRKDRTLGNVIINEKHNEKLRKHMVSDLPFPFVSVQQFERSISQPIGNTWNPETAYQRLIAPKIVTRLGKVIEPIDDSALLKK